MSLWFAGAPTGAVRASTEDVSRCKRHIDRRTVEQLAATRASCPGNMETHTKYPPSGRRRCHEDPVSVLYFPKNRQECGEEGHRAKRKITPPRKHDVMIRRDPPQREAAPFALENNDCPRSAYRGQKKRVDVPTAALRDDKDVFEYRRARTPPPGASRRVNQESTSEGRYLCYGCTPATKGEVSMISHVGKSHIDFEGRVKAFRENLEEMRALKAVQHRQEEIDRTTRIQEAAATPRRHGKNRSHTPTNTRRTPFALNLPTPNQCVGTPQRPVWRR